MSADWLFNDRKDVAVLTLKSIIWRGAPILAVWHDADDGGWQFRSLENADIDDAAVASLAEIVKLDPTVAELADLPLGWRAWRSTPADDWQRAPR